MYFGFTAAQQMPHCVSDSHMFAGEGETQRARERECTSRAPSYLIGDRTGSSPVHVLVFMPALRCALPPVCNARAHTHTRTHKPVPLVIATH